jgi:hypothetical protein
MGLARKRLVTMASLATNSSGIPVESRKQEGLLDDHYSEIGKLRDGGAGLVFSAGLEATLMWLSRNERANSMVR